MESGSAPHLIMTPQNNLLRRIERTLRYPARIAAELVEFTDLIGGDTSNDFYLPLMQKLVQSRLAQMNGAIFAFTSVSRGEGVSYVIGIIASELLRHSGEAVLVATAESLNGLEPSLFENAEAQTADAAKVWRLARAYPDCQPDVAIIHPEGLQLLRKRFGYVLVDCPALKESAAVFSIAPAAEGVVLVVAAGAKRSEIEQAQNALESSSCNILGSVLNKRTEPVPKLITKFL
jgi:hypothetical protein